MENSALYDEIISAINRADKIALFCHTNPDGDALGCELAMYLALKAMNKDVRAYCDTTIPKKYRKLTAVEAISMPEKYDADLAISVDCSTIDRLGACSKQYLSARQRIAIDHHESFHPFGQINCVESDAAACCQIVFKLLDRMCVIDKDIACLLFEGIITDSGCFQYSSVTKETHEIACKLMDYGIDAPKAIYDVFRSTDLDRFNLKIRVLGKVRFYAENRIALITFTSADFEATGTTYLDTEGIVSELIDIEGVKLAFAISENPTMSYKVSIRSKDGVNSSDVAAIFGGGGHSCAAGCRLDGFLEDVIDKLVRIGESFV